MWEDFVKGGLTYRIGREGRGKERWRIGGCLRFDDRSVENDRKLDCRWLRFRREMRWWDLGIGWLEWYNCYHSRTSLDGWARRRFRTCCADGRIQVSGFVYAGGGEIGSIRTVLTRPLPRLPVTEPTTPPTVPWTRPPPDWGVEAVGEPP